MSAQPEISPPARPRKRIAAKGAPMPGDAAGVATTGTEEIDRRDHRIADLERDLHALSHSIRSPLVALKGFAGLLEEEAGDTLGDNGRHFLGRISEAGRRIEWRLNDLGTLLAITDDPTTRTWVDLEPVLDDLGAVLKPMLERANARLIRPCDAPPIWCDQAQLRTALLHLIGNSLQHAVSDAQPDIHVRVHHGDEASEITVLDSGPGIEARLLGRAFSLFECSGERRRSFEEDRESTGLGLALVRRIAEAHAGQARIESEPGEGLRVVLSLPHP